MNWTPLATARLWQGRLRSLVWQEVRINIDKIYQACYQLFNEITLFKVYSDTLFIIKQSFIKDTQLITDTSTQ